MKTNKPLVSVCIPVYNHKNYVAKTIESIICQDYDNIELIIIDDGSTDGSNEIIESLIPICKQRFYRFEFIRKENTGLCSTLNQCISWVKGDYFSVIASDDYWPSYKINIQVEVMQKNTDYALCYGKQIGFDESDQERYFECKYYRSGYVFEDLITWRFSIPALTVLMRTSLFSELGNYDENVGIEDFDMWLRVSKNNKVLYLDEWLGYYRLHDENMSKNHIKMTTEKKKIIDKWKGDPLYAKALNRHYLIAFWKFSSCNKKDAISNLINNGTASWVFDKYFIKGVVKLFLPCKDYGKVNKYAK